VNVSARQFDDDSLLYDVRRTLDDSGLDPGALMLEVTETTLMRDTEATARRLVQLKQLGVLIAIDDFGTGYSSLAYLQRFPADVLKIDRSFVSAITTSSESAALIHTLVQLGKALHMETLAEGIEDQAQLEALRREHCDHGQGFLFSRPLEVDALERFLDAAPIALRVLQAL
jgi:EAL domain-containing protein (putative c-di-GMP-specific phosphodiesterase class I)